MGRPFHPAFTDLEIAPSSHLVRRVSFLFRRQPSPATPLGVVHPTVREELPQEIPVAYPPTRVKNLTSFKAIKPFSRERVQSQQMFFTLTSGGYEPFLLLQSFVGHG